MDSYDEDFGRWERKSLSAAGSSKIALKIVSYFRECKDACRVLSSLDGASFRAHNATLSGPKDSGSLKCFLNASRNSVYLDCSRTEGSIQKLEECISAARGLVSVILLEGVDLLEDNKLMFKIVTLLKEKCKHGSEVFLLSTALDVIPSALRNTRRMGHIIRIADLNFHERRGILLNIMRDLPINDKQKLATELALRTQNFTTRDHNILCMNAYIYHKSRKQAHMEINDFEEGIRRTLPLEFKQVSSPVPNVRLEDIFGMRGIKDNIVNTIILPLKHPEKNAQRGIYPPKGALIYGPTGVGKTFLSHVIANELNFRVINVDATRIRSKVVGESEKNVLRIFSKARANAPCLLILDQIDSLVPRRGSYLTSESTSERVISSFLVEIDGIFTIRDSSKQIFVIATTSNPESVEHAVLRAGRIDEHIHIPNPDHETRADLFKGFTEKIPNSLSGEDFSTLANLSKDFSCAEIKRVCHNAALRFLKGDLKNLTLDAVRAFLE